MVVVSNKVEATYQKPGDDIFKEQHIKQVQEMKIKKGLLDLVRGRRLFLKEEIHLDGKCRIHFSGNEKVQNRNLHV